MYESRLYLGQAQFDLKTTLGQEILPDTLAKVVQFFTNQAAKPTTVSFSELPPIEKIPDFFQSIYGNPRFSFPPERLSRKVHVSRLLKHKRR